MNRRNTENLVEDLLGDFEYELQVPYLLYRNPAQEVNGIWFYNPRECEDVANLFTRILGAYSKVPLKPKVNKSEFEELEAVPTSSVIEGPLEPPFTTSSSTDVPEDSSFANFFGSAMNLGHHPSNSVNSIPPYQSSTPLPLHSRVASSPALTHTPLQLPSYSSSNSGIGIPFHDTQDQTNNNNSTTHVTNLIKPLSFFTPSSTPTPTPYSIPSSAPGAPRLNTQQQSHGIPLLQPFPPPTPPLSLTPNYGSLSREKVRDALLILAQDNQFIDMFHQALLKVHQQ